MSIPPRALWDPSIFWHVLGDTACQEPYLVHSIGKIPLLFPSTLYSHTALSHQPFGLKHLMCLCVTQWGQECIPSFSYHENPVLITVTRSSQVQKKKKPPPHKEYPMGIGALRRTKRCITKKTPESIIVTGKKNVSCAHKMRTLCHHDPYVFFF